jgi:hypothetical protein
MYNKLDLEWPVLKMEADPRQHQAFLGCLNTATCFKVPVIALQGEKLVGYFLPDVGFREVSPAPLTCSIQEQMSSKYITVCASHPDTVFTKQESTTLKGYRTMARLVEWTEQLMRLYPGLKGDS